MAADTQQIKSVGVVGLGYWGPKLARCFHQLGVLKWVCDLNPGRVQEVQKLAPSIQGTTDYVFMLHHVDALAIATPPETHYEIAKRALLVGKHVFVEKPLATSYEDAVELEQLAEKKGLPLMVGHTYLHCRGLMAMNIVRGHASIRRPSGRVTLGISFLNKGEPPSRASGLKWASLPHAASIVLHFFPQPPDGIAGKRTDHSVMADLFYPDGDAVHIEVGDHMGRRERMVGILGEGISYYFNGGLPSEHITNTELGFHIVHLPEGEPLLLECQAFLQHSGVDPLGSQVVQLVESIWAASPPSDLVVPQVSAKPEVSLRPTEFSDLPLLLAWRHNPLVMRYFVDGGETWEQHMKWWLQQVVAGLVKSYIILYLGRPVGESHARIDFQGKALEVGLYIGETGLWGRGIGRRAMALLLEDVSQLIGPREALASVHPDNHRSMRMFAALGFAFVKVKEDSYLLFRREM